MPRLPEIRSKDKLPADKQDIIDYLVQTRGAVSNGFSVLLNSPEAASRIAQLGTFVRFESSLPGQIRELAALTASVEMGNPYERTIHTRDALKEGAGQATIDAVNARAPVDAATQDEALAVRCARELLNGHRLSEATFEAAHTRLGDQGVIDLVATVGYYAMLACLHNAVEVALPPA